MKAIQRILIPTDYSPTANNALLYGLSLAQALQAEVYILYACRIPSAATAAYPGGYYEAVNLEELQKEAEQRMERLRQDFLYAPKVPYHCLVQLGPTTEVIDRTAREKQVDLLVMGTRQAQRAQAWLGSVTTEVVQRSSCSVLVIPPEAPFVPPKRLVLATTLTHLSGLEMLRTLAQRFQATVDVLHIHPPLKEYSVEQKKFRDGLNHYLTGIYHRFYHIAHKDVAEGIQQFLDRHQVDMLVMLPRHHGLLDRLLHASQTRHMIFHSHKPLLALKE